MGLSKVEERMWRQPAFDRSARERALAMPGAVVELAEARNAGLETAALLGVPGGQRGAALAGWEDLCLVAPRGHEHVLIGGAVGFPTDWRLADKLGLPVAAVHAPIHGYAEKLAAGVEHFLAGLAPAAIFGRANWFVVESDALAYLPEGPPAERFAHVTPANAGRTLWVRCERQTFRRLPASGAVLFGIGVHLCRLDALPPALVADLADAVADLSAGEDARRAAPHYLPALRAYADALIGGGTVPAS